MAADARHELINELAMHIMESTTKGPVQWATEYVDNVLLADPKRLRRALDERGGGVQIHITEGPSADDSFARGRRVGYEEGRRSR